MQQFDQGRNFHRITCCDQSLCREFRKWAGSGTEPPYWEELEAVFKVAAAFQAAGPGARSIGIEQTPGRKFHTRKKGSGKNSSPKSAVFVTRPWQVGRAVAARCIIRQQFGML